MTMNNLIKNYPGKWVAMHPDTEKVIAKGSNVVSVQKAAQKKGVKIPTLFKVPTRYIPYIGHAT